MKIKLVLVSLLIALATPACQFRSGDGQKYTAWNLGIRETGVNQSGQSYIAASSDGTESFREGAQTARFGLGAAAFTSVAKSGFSALTSTSNAKTAASVTNAKTAADVTNAKTAADVTKHAATLEAEAAQQLVLPPVPVQ